MCDNNSDISTSDTQMTVDNYSDPRSQIVHMKKIQAEGLELFIKKNADYGNSYKQYGLIGVLVRLQDKINRALNISKNGIHVKDESLRDTLIDLHNYAAMALMESDPSLQEISISDAARRAMIPDTKYATMDRCINLR